MKEVYVQTRDEWRNWLSENHNKESGIWLIFFKKETGKASLEYEDAIEEALCFGWIDSIIKKLDDQRYARKFTPRKVDSRWSNSNKKRVLKMIEHNRMTPVGMAKIEAAKRSGLWDKPDRPQISFELPEILSNALAKNKRAKDFFEQLAPTYQKQYIGWIQIAKQQKTKEQRVKESINLLAQRKKLGLK
jgi:uncharacterized protein YdeI (YjbR/CyaY-like superfamily)